MKKIDIIIGMHFGDEGKGITTNYLCSNNEATLNIRFNGGAQAGHRVCLPDSREHIFSSFGAGSFNSKTDTYLSEYFIFNPILYFKEKETLLYKNVMKKLYVNSSCIVTTPYDMIYNQIHSEIYKHVSCGVGIYETICRNNSLRKITLDEFINTNNIDNLLKDIYMYYSYKVDKYFNENQKKRFFNFSDNEKIINKFKEEINNLKQELIIVNKESEKILLNLYNNIVFEGAQGLLLDQKNYQYYPYLTPSDTDLYNPIQILTNNNIKEIPNVYFITRSYMTKHGKGVFIQETNKENITLGQEETNFSNQYQGSFRYGFIEPYLSNGLLTNQKHLYDGFNYNEHIVITHLDETMNLMKTVHGNKKPEEVFINKSLLKSYTKEGIK